MDLTPMQRRTMTGLLDVGEGIDPDPELRGRLVARIEAGLAEIELRAPIRLWKERLNELDRCEGMFAASLTAGREAFRYRPESAAGTLLHKAIEIDVWADEGLDVHELAGRAAEAAGADRDFRPYWEGLDAVGRGECLMRTVSLLEQFRASFPPLAPFRRALAPVSELWLEARLARGLVTVVGRVDLVLNRVGPRRTRVLVDLKSGRSGPEHAEDMRLYALLYTLRYGVAPARVATFSLRSGEWQPEDVDDRTLEHAADRVVRAVAASSGVAAGRAPQLLPGGHCVRCPAGERCPEARPVGVDQLRAAAGVP